MIDKQVSCALRTFGAVVIQGPRASGNTATGLQLAASSTRLDSSPQLAAVAESSPASVLEGAVPRLIDEWQLAPNIWNAVRHAVDERSAPGQFILTGSATPADEVTRHSGAGRFRRITLRPMSLAESGESTESVSLQALLAGEHPFGEGGPTVPQLAASIARGGWPALVTRKSLDPAEYLGAYLDDVSRVDLPSSEIRVDPPRMSGIMRALARNTSSEAAVTRLAAEAGFDTGDAPLAIRTARRYLDGLTRVFVLEEQPAWAVALRSKVRLRTGPKWQYVCPSLAAAAIGATATRLMADLPTLGLFFESLCVRDLRIYGQPLDGSVYHYRDETGLEVNAIVELRDGSWAAFEVKLGGSRFIDDAARALLAVSSKVSPARRSQLRALTVLTAGTLSYHRPDGVNVVSLGHLKS